MFPFCIHANLLFQFLYCLVKCLNSKLNLIVLLSLLLNLFLSFFSIFCSVFTHEILVEYRRKLLFIADPLDSLFYHQSIFQLAQAPVIKVITPVQALNFAPALSKTALNEIVEYIKKKEKIEAEKLQKQRMLESLRKYEEVKQRKKEEAKQKRMEELKKRAEERRRERMLKEKERRKERERKAKAKSPRFQTEKEHRKFLVERFERDFEPLLGPVITELCKMQLRKNKLKKVLYTPRQMDIAIDIMRHCSQKAYIYLTTILPLPSFITVLRVMNKRKGIVKTETIPREADDDELTFDDDSDFEDDYNPANSNDELNKKLALIFVTNSEENKLD